MVDGDSCQFGWGGRFIHCVQGNGGYVEVEVLAVWKGWIFVVWHGKETVLWYRWSELEKAILMVYFKVFLG